MISRKLLIRVVLVCVLGISLLVGYCVVTGRRWQWEPVLHVFGFVSEDEVIVSREFNRFRQLVDLILISWDDTIVGDPPARLADYFAVEFPDKDRTFGKKPGWAFKYLDKGIDPWGSEFVFKSELTRDEEGMGVLFLTVRSIGANRIDEGGEGDDLQQVMEFSCLLASERGDSGSGWEYEEIGPSSRAGATERQRKRK